MNDHFFIIGAQRSGTTYLYNALDSHPAIEMARPLRPEPKYFLNTPSEAIDVATYEHTYFSGKPGARLLGEKSTSYFESEAAAQRIAATFPNAKLVALLRDPVQRAVSNYYFSVENGLETVPIEEAFRLEEERLHTGHPSTSVSPFAYIRRGRYIDYLSKYERYFPRDQLIILIHEQFVGLAAAFRALCDRLGVGDHLPPGLDERVNATHPRKPLSAALDAYLRDIFADPNERLAARYGLDLRAWSPNDEPPASG